eukprot:NODE_2699_length_879_cov_86.513253_g2226_i0.p3 GENE.NODE_2699_length_879_cov_86.513253_g2226_i0~~NODE_2699_length_879_cov_86.513253_g2226_i0.p3  ORF type:complete len:57 (+),score=4.25 NODE_2699_length_879_cov_86.513253_g2226_i0:136-306(+)
MHVCVCCIHAQLLGENGQANKTPKVVGILTIHRLAIQEYCNDRVLHKTQATRMGLS